MERSEFTLPLTPEYFTDVGLYAAGMCAALEGYALPEDAARLAQEGYEDGLAFGTTTKLSYFGNNPFLVRQGEWYDRVRAWEVIHPGVINGDSFDWDEYAEHVGLRRTETSLIPDSDIYLASFGNGTGRYYFSFDPKKEKGAVYHCDGVSWVLAKRME